MTQIKLQLMTCLNRERGYLDGGGGGGKIKKGKKGGGGGGGGDGAGVGGGGEGRGGGAGGGVPFEPCIAGVKRASHGGEKRGFLGRGPGGGEKKRVKKWLGGGACRDSGWY